MTDLGVILDSKLSFREHIDSVVNKGSAMFGLIKRLSREFRMFALNLSCSSFYSNLLLLTLCRVSLVVFRMVTFVEQENFFTFGHF
jgi:type III secretory pathway component EscT